MNQTSTFDENRAGTAKAGVRDFEDMAKVVKEAKQKAQRIQKDLRQRQIKDPKLFKSKYASFFPLEPV